MSKAALAIEAPVRKRRRRRSIKMSLKHHGTIYLFLLPAIGFFCVFSVYPILYSLVMSFTNWPLTSALGPTVFVGFQNYMSVLNDPVVLTSFRNSLLFLVVSVPLQICLGMLVAIGLDRPMRGRTTFRLLYFFPYLTSWVVVTFIFEYLFNTDYGFVNWLLESLHVIQSPIAWLADPRLALVVSAILGAWKGIGWAMMIFLAALQAVPDELHEAAAIDGAGTWHRFWSVTLPSIRSSIFFVSVLLVMGAFQMFMQIFILTAGGPANESEVPMVWMYEQAFSNLQFGYASAFSWIITVFIVAATLIQFWIFRPKSLNVREG